jgi:hypothetical protein
VKKIVIHWTAGPYDMTQADFLHYHYTIGPNGEINHGKFSVDDNIPPLRAGKYAAHCGGGNSYSIGVALRGMAGYTSPTHIGPFPLTKKQCETAWQFVAGLCKGYGITVSEDTVYSHYEYGIRYPKTSSAGKIDITYLPHEPTLKRDQVGGYIRKKVNWYLGKPNTKAVNNASHDKP